MSNVTIDRALANRFLARAIAFSECGDAPQADENARKLMKLLRDAGILGTQQQGRGILGLGKKD